MEFMVSRTSAWDAKPCEGAYRKKFTTLTGSDPVKQPSMKPHKPWEDRKKKQIAEGKRTDAELEVCNEEEIARWERKKEEQK